jgi:hypothetical protein
LRPCTSGARISIFVSGFPAEHRLGDLGRTLPLNGPSAVWAVRRAGAREEQAEVVVDLGDGPTVDRGLWPAVFCSIEIAGDSPSIASTSGFSISPRN